MTKVSIVMSVYNGESNVEKTIDSVLNQSYRDFEFIIINDHSKDNTKNLLEKVARKDNRIKVINNKRNLGLSKSLYNAIKIAEGDYIARIDSGDLMFKDRLKIQKEILDDSANREIGIVTTNCEVFYLDNGVTKKSILIVPETNEKILKKMPFKNVIPHVSVMFRKNTYNLVKGYDPNLSTSQDGDLWAKMLKICEVYPLQQILTKIVFDKNLESITLHKNKEQRKNSIKIALRSIRLGTYPLHLMIMGLIKKLIFFALPKSLLNIVNTIKFKNRRKL